MNAAPSAPRPVLGLALWLVKAPRLAGRATWAAENGFSSLSLNEAHIEVPLDQKIEAAQVIREWGLDLTWHFDLQAWLGNHDITEADATAMILDEVLWWHEYAGGVRSLLFDTIGRRDPESNQWVFDRDRTVRLMSAAAERLARPEIPVGLENGIAGFNTAADMAGLLADEPQLAPHLLLDLGHANIHLQSHGRDRSPLDIGAYIRDIPMIIQEVHVHDNNGERDQHGGLGNGSLQISAAVAALVSRGYDGPLTVEVCNQAPGNNAADVSRSAEAAPLLATRDRLARELDRL